MKKILMIIAVLFMVGCTPKQSNTGSLDTNEISNQLATTTFISQGLINSDTSTLTGMSNSNFGGAVRFLAATSEVESRIDQMLIYFERIDVFMDGSPEEVLDIKPMDSELDGYDFQVSYSEDNVSYTIYYNVFETGDANEFELEGLLEYNGMSLEIIGGSESEDGELEMFFETHEDGTDNYVRIEVEKEGNEEYYEIESFFDGEETYSEISLEKDGREGEIEIYTESNGVETEYEISREPEDGTMIYTIEYTTGNVSGTITMTTFTVDGVEVTYFTIEEGDYYKEYSDPAGYMNPDEV